MDHIFFICSSVDGHLGCFHLLATVNSAAVNRGANTCSSPCFRSSVNVLSSCPFSEYLGCVQSLRFVNNDVLNISVSELLAKGIWKITQHSSLGIGIVISELISNAWSQALPHHSLPAPEALASCVFNNFSFFLFGS